MKNLQLIRGEVRRFLKPFREPKITYPGGCFKPPSAGLTEKQNRETPEILEKWNEMAISKSTN